MERFDLNSDSIFHRIKPEIETPGEGLSKYYGKITLHKKETKREIGLTVPPSTRVPPTEIDIQDTQCYAKIYIYKRANGAEGRKYFVKADVGGMLFSPWGMYSEGTAGEYNKKAGRFRWTFTEVSSDCFWQYCTFIQTRKDIYLYHAQRLSVQL